MCGAAKNISGLIVTQLYKGLYFVEEGTVAGTVSLDKLGQALFTMNRWLSS